MEQAPRIVLIDDKGESYQCVSNGVWGSLKKMFAVYGAPTYEEPINVVVKQVKVKRGTMLTLEVALSSQSQAAPSVRPFFRRKPCCRLQTRI